METFQALVVDKAGEATSLAVQHWRLDQLLPGDVTIQIEYSSVNYKDALASRVDGKVARRYPLILGIDLAGTVSASDDVRFQPGQKVLAHGWDLGVAHHGGMAGFARVPAAWVVPLPHDLTTRQAMVIGTAGFTAALSIERLEYLGLRPQSGPVLVTGASGGVGSIAVALLAKRGYQVAASTGSLAARDYLRSLGAQEILDRAETSAASERPLERARWAGAVDPVGGATLSYLLRTMAPRASIALSGNTGGGVLATTVFPFILRGVNLLGIDSATYPQDLRSELWKRLAGDLRPPLLEEMIGREVSLEEVPTVLQNLLQGRGNGRTIVRLRS